MRALSGRDILVDELKFESINSMKAVKDSDAAAHALEKP